jgi:AraC-like DNA-binding protein
MPVNHWVDILGTLPTGACLFWLLFYCLAASRTSSFRVTFALLLSLGVYLVAPKTVFALLSGPCLIPLMMHYLNRIRKDDHPRFYEVLWIVFPAILFTWGVLLKILAPPERLLEYEATLRSLFHLILYIELFVFIGYLTYYSIKEKKKPFSSMYAFLFKGKSIPVLLLQYYILGYCTFVFLLIAMPSLDPYETPITPAFFAAGVFLFAYVALLGTKKTVTLKELKYLVVYNFCSKNRRETIKTIIGHLLEESSEEEMEQCQDLINQLLHKGEEVRQPSSSISLTSHIYAAAPSAWSSHDDLFERFKDLVIEKKLYLHPGLTLQDVADQLDTNKTYVSKMVNNTYNLGFPELLNTLRVDYAGKYLLSHKNAKQTEVATASGFQSASSFNNIFKKVTGLTPKLWVASKDKK